MGKRLSGKKWLVGWVLFFSTVYSVVYAQIPEEYNKVYSKVYFETSQKDFKKAVKIADSLYSISETPLFKARSLMLSAALYQQSNDIKAAVNYAMKAEKELSETEEYTWKAKVYGFLSTQYRNLGLFDQSKKYTDKTQETVKKINNPAMVSHIMGFVMQEKAYYELEMKNYKSSIAFVKKSQHYFDLSDDGQNQDFLNANNEQLLGLNYYYLNDYDKALDYYNAALSKLDKMPDNFLKGLVYNGLAQVYIGKKNEKEAEKYIDKAKKISDESKYLSLKNEIYKTSQKYYALTKDIEKLDEAKVKQDSIVAEIEGKSMAFINESYSGLDKKNEEIEQQTRKKNIIILSGVFLILAGIVYFIFYRRKQKRDYDKIKQILEELDKKQKEKQDQESIEPVSKYTDIEENVSEAQDTEQSPMTSATEEKLIAKLYRFEQSTLYTRNNISLPYLASYCDTNIKYLSYVINTHKKKDFKNYINELRVKYIIDKVRTSEKHQKYKISALAEEAGFSSQSKFAAAFKKVTTVSPSQFLQHLREMQ